MSVITIHKKNEYGFLNKIYPDRIITTNSRYQLRNDIKCNICDKIPVLYKITKSNHTMYYICYNCSKSDTLMKYYFGPYEYEILKKQDDPYEE